MPDYPPLPPRPRLRSATPTQPERFEAPGPALWDSNRPKVDIDDPAGTLRGKYDRETIRTLVTAAKRHGVDPATILAMGIQETGLNPADPLHFNFFSPTDDEDLNARTIRRNSVTGAEQYFNDVGIDHAVEHFKERGASRGPDAPEEERIQAYNGMGRINPRVYPRMYGMDTKDLPPNFYGKRIQDVRERVVRPSLKGLLSLAND